MVQVVGIIWDFGSVDHLLKSPIGTTLNPSEIYQNIFRAILIGAKEFLQQEDKNSTGTDSIFTDLFVKPLCVVGQGIMKWTLKINYIGIPISPSQTSVKLIFLGIFS